MSPGQHHFLYRFYDADGALLYIGATVSLTTRIADHRGANRGRWSEVSEIRAVRLRDRNTLSRAEAVAIESERPKWNKAPGRYPRDPALAPPRPARPVHACACVRHETLAHLVACKASIPVEGVVLPRDLALLR